MKTKIIIPIILIFILIFTVNAADYPLCNNPAIPPCSLITPQLTCDTYTYETLDLNGTSIDSNELTPFNNTQYTLNVTYAQGGYSINLCDNSTMMLLVGENEQNVYNITLLGFIVMIGLLVLSYAFKNKWFVVVAGMASIVLALHIFNQGLPSLTPFLQNTLTIILAGIGMYLIIAPMLVEETDDDTSD